MDIRLLKPRWLLIAAGLLLSSLAYLGGPAEAAPEGRRLAPAGVAAAADIGDATERPAPAVPAGGRLSPVPASAPPELGLAMGSLTSRSSAAGLGSRSSPDGALRRQQQPAILLTTDLTPGCVQLPGLLPPTLDCNIVAGRDWVQNVRAELQGGVAGSLVRIDLAGMLEGMSFVPLDGLGTELTGPVEAVDSVSGRLRFRPGELQLTAPDAPIVLRYKASAPGQAATVGAEAEVRLHVLPDLGGNVVGVGFADADRDGQRDAGEGSLASWQVSLTGASGTLQTLSDGMGRFAFPALPAGTYTVTMPAQVGWQPTRPDLVVLTLPENSPGAIFELLFGHRQTATSPSVTARLQTDRGCVEAGQDPSYLLREGLTVYLEAAGLPQVEVTLRQRDAAGQLRTLVDRQSIPGAQAFSFGALAGDQIGPHALLLEVFAPGQTAVAATATCGYRVDQPLDATVAYEPTSMNFGSVAVGASSSGDVTIKNLGGAPLVINTVGVQGGGGSPFLIGTLDAGGQTLAPGQSYVIALAFAPRAPGSYQDFLLIRCNAPNEPLISIPLYGQTPTGGAVGAGWIRTDRGCIETGQSPLYFVNDPIQLQLRVDSGIESQALIRVDDVTPTGQVQTVIAPRAIETNRTYTMGGLRVVPPVGQEAVRLTAQVGYELIRNECSFGVAAGGTRIIGYKFNDLNANGIWEGCPLTPQVPGNEPPIPGWGINLTGPQSAQTYTDANGRFEFVVSAPGAYGVTEESRAGWLPSRQPQIAVNVSCYPGESLPPMLFGNYGCDIVDPTPDPGGTPWPTATISGWPTPTTATATAAIPTDMPTAGPSPTPTATVIGGASPTATPPIPPPPPVCTAVISPRPSLMNVAQLAQFAVGVTGGGTVTGYQWTVDGEIIRDYQETTRFGWSVTPMQTADYQRQNLAFYWKPLANQRHPQNAGPQARRVGVTVTTTLGQCTVEHTLNVERNNYDITRQADDYYTTNHGSAIQTEHSFWHGQYPFTGWTYDGTLFFDFHRQFLNRFDNWRAEFGYPPIGIWDSGTSIPRGVDIDHAARGGTYAVQPKPSWFTLSGTIRRPTNGLPCDTTGGGQRRLQDYPANRRLLGCAVTHTWHNTVHTAVGGDMLNVPFSPRDPIFWRWHNFVDAVSQERQGVLFTAAMALVDPFGQIEQEDQPDKPRDPQVVYEEPFRIYRFIDALPSFMVQFDQSVSGVTADDLTVNGSVATTVSQGPDNRWTFSGFPAPPVGAVTIKLASGGIRNIDNVNFPGREWTYQRVRVDEGLDEDRDGLTNAREVWETLTNPQDRDHEDDGLPDGDEVDLYHTSPHLADTDADGAGDRCELDKGSDPLDPASTARGCPVSKVFFCWAGNRAGDER